MRFCSPGYQPKGSKIQTFWHSRAGLKIDIIHRLVVLGGQDLVDS